MSEKKLDTVNPLAEELEWLRCKKLNELVEIEKIIKVLKQNSELEDLIRKTMRIINTGRSI